MLGLLTKSFANQCHAIATIDTVKRNVNNYVVVLTLYYQSFPLLFPLPSTDRTLQSRLPLPKSPGSTSTVDPTGVVSARTGM